MPTHRLTWLRLVLLLKLSSLSWNPHNSPPHPPLHKGRLKSPKLLGSGRRIWNGKVVEEKGWMIKISVYAYFNFLQTIQNTLPFLIVVSQKGDKISQPVWFYYDFLLWKKLYQTTAPYPYPSLVILNLQCSKRSKM